MTEKEYLLWYNENKTSFLRYKARFILQRSGKEFREVDELVAQTVAIMYEKLDSLNPETINSFAFLTLQNVFYNTFYRGFYTKNICCVGDVGMSDFGVKENEYQLKQSKLIDNQPNEEIIFTSKQKGLLERYIKLLPHEQKIVDTYIELRSYLKVAKALNTEVKTVKWIINRIQKDVKIKPGFLNSTKKCYICGGKYKASGLCHKHYSQKMRGKL